MYPTFTLNNGTVLPAIGYGTYKIDNDDDAAQCVEMALELGYRHVDTAVLYRNEAGVGRGMEDSYIARKEIFLTTKLWTDATDKEKVYASVENSLRLLKTDYLDLLLIHWPTPYVKETYAAMEQLYKAGVVRAIGVSNFLPHHLDELMENATVMPAVNQVEFHPVFQQKELRAYCEKKGIQLQAWSPLLRGSILNDPLLLQLAERYDKTSAQIVLRWDYQCGIATIPKTTFPLRMIENLSIFDFELSKEDMQRIATLDTDTRRYRHPDHHGFCPQ